MLNELKDNSATLFGREPDLHQLRLRALHSGVTAVTGRPQMGKSWLLTELARQLAATRTATSESSLLNRGYLVGFHEARGETPDLLLRTVSDLYTRWLGESSFRDQAKAYYLENQENFIGNTGKAAASILSKLAGLAGPTLKVITEAIAEATKQLVDANDQLVSGGLQFKPLQIDQARDLLQIVHQITGNPLILIFDQWEKSPGIKLEGDILDSFLRHLDDWPPCHIFVALREEDPAQSAVETLRDNYPGDCELYPLLPMHLESESSQNALLDYIHDQIPATQDFSDSEILGLIDGYPCVVSRWVKSRASLHSFADLKRVAGDAHAFRYPEFRKLLPQLTTSERRLACRIVFLPLSSDPAYAEALKPIVLGASPETDRDLLQEDSLDRLVRLEILEKPFPPTYGHDKRTQAARRWFQSECRAELPGVLSQLILTLGNRINATSDENLPYSFSLQLLHAESQFRLQLPFLAQAVLEANISLFPDSETGADVFLKLSIPGENLLDRVAPLLSMGLNNSLVHAKAKDNLSRRDSLLEQLRKLERAWPEDAAVRENFAMGLYNTLNHAKAEDNLSRRDSLIEELRNLQRTWPDDTAVRETLAMGLCSTLDEAKEEDNLSRRDSLLEELRNLQITWPDDTAVRERLAKGLYNTLIDAKAEDNLSLRDGLLEELRNLQRAWPDDAVVRENLADGLYNTLNDAKAEDNLSLRDSLLEELRDLQRASPDDAAVRELLAQSHYNTLIDAKAEDNLSLRDGLLEELRNLQRAWPDDAAVRKQLARGLLRTRMDVNQEGNRDRAPLLLVELQTLISEYPEDPFLQQVDRVLAKLLNADPPQA